MGAWDEGMNGNDFALDVEAEIDEYIKSGKTPREAFDQIKIDITNPECYMDSNWHILGLAFYQLKKLKSIDDDILKMAVMALNRELETTNEWTEPKIREHELLNFKKKLEKYTEKI